MKKRTIGVAFIVFIFGMFADLKSSWLDQLRHGYGYGTIHSSTVSRDDFEILPGVQRNTFCHGLHKVESKTDNYLAFNASTSALGRYQFVPKYFREDIQKVTGAQTYEDFLQTASYQEQFMDWYIDDTLLPGFQKVVDTVDAEIYTYAEVLALVHFLGANGTIEYIPSKQMNPKQQVGNIQAQRYLEIVNSAMEAYTPPEEKL